MATSKLIYKGFTGSHEVSLEDGCIIGKVLFVDDIITYEGETVAELTEAFKASVDRYLAYCKKTGKAANKPYSGTFNVRVGPELHREAVVAASEAALNLNEFVTQAIEAAVHKDQFTPVVHNHNHITIQHAPEMPWRSAMATTSHNLEKFSANTLQ